MGELFPLFLICFFAGGLLLWATFSGSSMAPVLTGIIGIYFIFLPISLALGWNKVFIIMLTLPLGLLWTIMAFLGITSPFRYRIKREATYIQPIYEHKGRNHSTKYYVLQCRIPVGKHIRQINSEDWYELSLIEKKYTPGTTITVWVNKKHEERFLVRRFSGVVSHLFLILPGIGFLVIAIKALLNLPIQL